jgi:hypothetical protein
MWTEIKSPPGTFVPIERSGHSCDVFENFMLVFGGIFEITKELNDFSIFDFRTNRWVSLFEETHSPKKGLDGNSPLLKEDSPQNFFGDRSPGRRN